MDGWVSSPAIANGKVYVTTGNGMIYCFGKKVKSSEAISDIIKGRDINLQKIIDILSIITGKYNKFY